MKNKTFDQKRTTVLTYVGLIAFFALIFGGPLEQLLFGWLYFPLRVVPQLNPDFMTLIFGIASTVAFVAGLHYLIRKFTGETSVPTQSHSNWKFRSSIAISAMILMLFVTGIAMVGATHQFIWLLTGRVNRPAEPQAVSRRWIPSLLDSVDDARQSAMRSQQRSSLRMLGMGILGAVERSETLPPGGVMTEDGTLLHGWATLISGYGDYFISDELNYRIPWNQPPNDHVFKCQLGSFVNPSLPGPYFDSEGFGLSHVAGNSHVLMIRTVTVPPDRVRFSRSSEWYGSPQDPNQTIKLADIVDGQSNTILIGTVAAGFKPWGHPANLRDPASGINQNSNSFGGPQSWGGAQFLMCDGTVKFLSEKTDPKILSALATPNGGETLSPKDLSVLSKSPAY